jgi:hypothetical protein
VFKNRVLRRILGPKRDEVRREWSRLHKEELHDLYASPNDTGAIKLRIRWAGYADRMWEMRGACRVLVGKHEWKRPLGRPRCR